MEERADSVQPVLEVVEVSKTFGSTRALVGVSVSFHPGKVHAVVGQNGSGKSTLVKVLTSVVPADEGAVAKNGVVLSHPWLPCHQFGIAVVHQDLGLDESMSALDNFGIVAANGVRGLRLINWSRERRLFRQYCDRVGLSISPDALVGDLLASQRAMLAILRALRQLDGAQDGRPGMLILDEPSVYLPHRETQVLRKLIRDVAAHGTAVLLISHDITEVKEVADTITVLRDGHATYSGPSTGVSSDQIVSLMLGRTLDRLYPPKTEVPPRAPTVLRAKALCSSVLEDFSLELHSGEIVGVTGLAGMGQDLVPNLLSGRSRPARGEVYLLSPDGSTRTPVGPRTSSKIGLVPANRVKDAIWPDGSLKENLTIASLGSVSGARRLGLRRKYESTYATGQLQTFGVVPPRQELPIRTLSGGNQQKLVLARWLVDKRPVYVIHEPTAGVDVGATVDVHRSIVSAAADGAGVVIVSVDYEQLANLCHRVLVMRFGRLQSELRDDELTPDAIARACHNSGPLQEPPAGASHEMRSHERGN